MFRDLEARYAEPWRVYHTMPHILACLAELERVRPMARDADAVRAALWYHDAVWVAGRQDNEDRSATLADAALAAGGVDASRRRAVAGLILATRHAAVPSDPDAQLIADIDLTILGADPVTYDEYERAVRREYAHLSDKAFAAGRAAFAGKLLERPRLYATGRFHRRLEARARANLARSAARA